MFYKSLGNIKDVNNNCLCFTSELYYTNNTFFKQYKIHQKSPKTLIHVVIQITTWKKIYTKKKRQ